jgi:hypothetical protein
MIKTDDTVPEIENAESYLKRGNKYFELENYKGALKITIKL